MKKTRFALLFLICAVMLTVVACSDSETAPDNELTDLPDGDLLTTAECEDGTYCAEAYLCSFEGKMHIRCAVVAVSSNKSRNIYWDEYDNELDIQWVDNSTLKIDGKTLNVINDIYDCRTDN